MVRGMASTLATRYAAASSVGAGNLADGPRIGHATIEQVAQRRGAKASLVGEGLAVETTPKEPTEHWDVASASLSRAAYDECHPHAREGEPVRNFKRNSTHHPGDSFIMHCQRSRGSGVHWMTMGPNTSPVYTGLVTQFWSKT